MEKDSIIILSGGLDSTTLLHAEKERIAMAVTFDYGSNHNDREIECALWQCNELGIPHLLISLSFISDYFNSSLLSGAEAIPDGHYEEMTMKSTVVPFRNGIMLAVACGLAENYGLKHVLMANHGGDHAIYPDCRPGFAQAMSKAMEEGTYEGITLLAPFTNISKTEIAAKAYSLGVDLAHTYSCYKGGVNHCGCCGTCEERKEAFRLAGVPDPTIYDE